MKTAVVGSRHIHMHDLSAYLPPNTTEIVSGGAKGIDACAAEYARAVGLALVEFRPDYRRYGRGAPLKRNIDMILYADFVLIIWDGESRGTHFVVEQCRKMNKPHQIILR